jgi:hypothetical protein
MAAADRGRSRKIDIGECRRSPWRYLTQLKNSGDLWPGKRARNGGSAELRHRAGPAGAPPRCGRRQCIHNTGLDDEWIVGIGHARRRTRVAKIPPQCQTEEFDRRSAHDRAEIMDQVRLISKAAGICDIRPSSGRSSARRQPFRFAPVAHIVWGWSRISRGSRATGAAR